MTLQDISAIARDGGLLFVAWHLAARLGPVGTRLVQLCEAIAAKVGAVVPPPTPPLVPPPPTSAGGILGPILNILTGVKSMLRIRWPFRFAFLAAATSALFSLAGCSAVDGATSTTKRAICLVGNIGTAACAVLTGEPAPAAAPRSMSHAGVPSPAELAPLPASSPAPEESCPGRGCLVPASDR